MPPKVYVEKPLQVYGEQYFAATQPPIFGVCNCGVNPMFPGPHAHPGRWAEIHDTDWFLTSKYSGLLVEVIPDAEFRERFTGPPAEG
jgi:hypothetical protein